MVQTAFVLAGGRGTRLRAAVPHVPKPLAIVAGRPFLEYLLDYLCGEHVEEIVLCVGYRSNMIEGHFGDSYKGRPIRYSMETEALGTGGALSHALAAFQPEGPFLVCNGDTLFPVDTSALASGLHHESWSIAAFSPGNFGRYGSLIVGPRGELRALRAGFGEPLSSEIEHAYANSGLWLGNSELVTAPLLESDTNYSLEDYLQRSISGGTATAMVRKFDTPFIDIGVPADFARSQTMELFSHTENWNV